MPTGQKNVTKSDPEKHGWRHVVLLIVHITVLIGAVALVLMISFDTFRNTSFVDDPRYIHLQFWVCLLFLVDIIIEFAFSQRKWRYVLRHIFFFIIAIPYINILDWLGIPLDHQLQYLVGFIPMLRAAYVLAIITAALTGDKISSIFTAYISLLVTIVYFASMLFFIEEHTVNPDVKTYASALWWSVMNMTTAGCYITEYTLTGKVLSVILSGGGLILFPVFTVYVTQAVTRNVTMKTVAKPVK